MGDKIRVHVLDAVSSEEEAEEAIHRVLYGFGGAVICPVDLGGQCICAFGFGYYGPGVGRDTFRTFDDSLAGIRGLTLGYFYGETDQKECVYVTQPFSKGDLEAAIGEIKAIEFPFGIFTEGDYLKVWKRSLKIFDLRVGLGVDPVFDPEPEQRFENADQWVQSAVCAALGDGWELAGIACSTVFALELYLRGLLKTHELLYEAKFAPHAITTSVKTGSEEMPEISLVIYDDVWFARMGVGQAGAVLMDEGGVVVDLAQPTS